MQNIQIYFDAKQHKYTDNFTNSYTSVTTVIGNYENKFSDKEWDIAKACERIGKNPRHPKYPRYKNKTAKQIISGWKKEGDKARKIGNNTHDYIENSVKFSSNFINPFTSTTNRIFTIIDYINDPTLNKGIIDLDKFMGSGLKDRFPEVYKTLFLFVEGGWKIYSEIAVFNYDWLVAGLVDILLIRDDEFIILDWKTNKAPIQFKAGYYAKDNNGNLDGYIETDETLKYPLNNLPNSVGTKYTLQVNTYKHLLLQYGLTCKGLLLCHILHDKYDKDHPKVEKNSNLLGKQIVNMLVLDDMKDEVEKMLNHFTKSKLKSNNNQTSLFHV